MLSEEEIRKLQPYLQIKIDMREIDMRDLTKGYKENVSGKNFFTCNVPRNIKTEPIT